jgi:hypothetical protein
VCISELCLSWEIVGSKFAISCIEYSDQGLSDGSRIACVLLQCFQTAPPPLLTRYILDVGTPLYRKSNLSHTAYIQESDLGLLRCRLVSPHFVLPHKYLSRNLRYRTNRVNVAEECTAVGRGDQYGVTIYYVGIYHPQC